MSKFCIKWKYGDMKFDYFDHQYNRTRENERRVEIPIASFWLSAAPILGRVEVGCVMPHYENVTHTVIDLYEDFNGIPLRIAAKDYDYKGKNVLCVSTIEHVEHDVNYCSLTGFNPQAAPELLNRIYDDCNSCLFTWPSGVHPELDKFIYSKFDLWDVKLLLRADEDGNWVQVWDKELILKTKYANPFPSGNLLIVLEK